MKQKLLNKLWLRVGMIVAIMTTALAGTVKATDFTLSSASSVTQDGITVSFAQGSGSTAPTWYAAGLRLYASNTITISSSSTITGVTFNWEKQGSKAFASATANVGTYSHPSAAGEGTWTGSANEVVFTIGSSGQLQLNTFSVTVSSGSATPTCATPTFSPAAGAVVSGTEVSISSTEGATIYYTTNGTTPSTSSSVYSTPIEITAATTIKAFATKTDYNDSEVATAAYTIKPTVSGYAIDFENDVDCFVDWSFTNVGIHTTGVTSAHGGSAWGSNVNASDNATQTAIIQTKEKVAYPDVFTCYISKESSNTTSSTWYIQVSSDGSTWNDIASLSSMIQNTWTEFTGNIKAAGYTNVYVRLYYNGSNAKRAVDDISLTTYTPAAVEAPSITVTSPFTFSTSVSMSCVTDGATIYYTTDGTAPTSSSTAYTEPFNINATTTIKAIAIKNSDESTVTEVTATKELAAPTVAISASSIIIGATANVTTDGPAVTLTTSDASIASVSGTTVTGVAAGSATITATWSANSDYSAGTQNFTVTVTDPNAPGSENNPYTVTQALTAINALANNGTIDDVYVSGIVCTTGSISSGTITYYISADGTETSRLQVYKGKGLSNASFAAATDIEIYDKVVVFGQLKKYVNNNNVTIPEFNSGNYLISQTHRSVNTITVVGGTSKSIDLGNNETSVALSATAANGAIVTFAVDATNSTLAAVDYTFENGTLTVTNASSLGGNVVIIASADGDVDYYDGTATITVSVSPATKTDNEILLDETSGSTAYGTPLDVTYVVEDGYDGTMTYTTTNSAIADVAFGADVITFTPKAVGTAVFTISAPATTTFNAADDVTFTLTVTAPAGGTTAYVGAATTATLAFGENAFDLPNSSSSTDGSYTNGTYSISISNASSYYYFSSASLFIGKSGATVTLPAFDKVVTQIDVVGRDGASSKVTENIFVTVNEEDVAVSTAATGSTSTNEFVINSDYRDIGTIYKLKVTNSNNAQITSIVVHFAATSITATLNGSGYATYCSQYPLDFSAATDYSAWQITSVSDETITFSQITGSVKGGTGILLKGAAGETITLTSADSDNTLSGNKLEGTLAPTYVAADTYYGLSGNQFKKVNAGTVPAGKALLPASVVVGSGVKAFTFVFEEDDPTGISTVNGEGLMANDPIYNLAGQRISKMQKGINIVNGKKIMY